MNAIRKDAHLPRVSRCEGDLAELLEAGKELGHTLGADFRKLHGLIHMLEK